MKRWLLAASLLFAAALQADATSPILRRLAIPRREITLFGQRIVYYEAGHGRPLILLANLGWDANAWAQNLPALAKDHRVIALDLLGMGGSDKPLIDYKMNTWTDFLAEFLRRKQIPKATVIGAVMGGALAVQFALDHPEMTEAIVVAASNSGPGKHEGGDKSPPSGPSLAGTRQSLELAFFDDSLITDEVVRGRFEFRLKTNDGYTIQRHLGDHRAPYSREELAAIHAPALVVWCREDAITPLSWGEDYAAALPGAKLTVLERCGHLPNLEQPAAFDRAVLDSPDTRFVLAGMVQRDRAAVELREVAHDREAEARARRRFVRAHAALQHCFAERRVEAGAVVVDRDHDVAFFDRRGDRHARARPLAGVVEEVAEELVQIFALAAEGVGRRDVDVDREVARRMQPLHRPHEPFH